MPSVGTALIFEGGGMRASYTSAMVVALLEAGIHLPWTGGISAGSTHVANYVSRDAWRARHAFTDFASDPNFGGWRTFVRGQGVFNSDYIYRNTSEPDEALPFDWEAFTTSGTDFRIGAFNATTGQQVYWGREDIVTMFDLMIRVQASSTLPVLMPPVTIDGQVYVDGALGPTGGFALDAAKADGYDSFLVVLSQERHFTKPRHRHLWAVQRQFRRYPAVVEAVKQRAANYNKTRRELLELERQGRAYLFCPDHMPVTTGERRVPVLRASHEAGLAQARRELPRIVDFLAQANA